MDNQFPDPITDFLRALHFQQRGNCMNKLNFQVDTVCRVVPIEERIVLLQQSITELEQKTVELVSLLEQLKIKYRI